MAAAKEKTVKSDVETDVKASPDTAIDEITYVPEEGDPVRTKWNGLEFKAHVPTKVSRKHTVQVLKKVESTLPDGTVVSRAVEARIPMVELAKGNCRFMVNGVPPQERGTGKVATPENSDEYRGYCMRWIAQSTQAGAMDARWSSEEKLREKCGCDDHDIAYLRPFFEARHEALSSGGIKEVAMGMTPAEMRLGN